MSYLAPLWTRLSHVAPGIAVGRNISCRTWHCCESDYLMSYQPPLWARLFHVTPGTAMGQIVSCVCRNISCLTCHFRGPDYLMSYLALLWTEYLMSHAMPWAGLSHVVPGTAVGGISPVPGSAVGWILSCRTWH
jgi:hypothetical protein